MKLFLEREGPLSSYLLIFYSYLLFYKKSFCQYLCNY